LFLPTTLDEVKKLGWDQLDVILITGDSYIDSPFIGIAVIGKILLNAGYRVGMIAQPDVDSPDDITRLGEPALFWGLSGGSIDSMLANYTAVKKPRKSDDYTPGGINNRRPDRAVIVYSNLVRRYFKNTTPIILGGIEASLRRIAHYDYWSNSIRGSILFNAKADILAYGMSERTILEIAKALKTKTPIEDIRGICYIAKAEKPGYITLPSLSEVRANKRQFIEMFHTFYKNNDPKNALGLCQKHGDRFLIQNPPADYLNRDELDRVYAMDFENEQHPYYEKQGQVKALETIKFSITTHRGCYGECNFCAIAVHEGRTIRWRSEESILSSAHKLTEDTDFKGYIQDLSAPTANMYGFECDKKVKSGSCKDRRCLYPEICPQLPVNHSHHLNLLRKMRKIKGVKKVFVASGLRYDLLLHDKKHLDSYLNELVEHHVSGQLKIAPEHSEDKVLNLMGKPGQKSLLSFRNKYNTLNQEIKKKQFLTYYMIAAHPGCTKTDMAKLKHFAGEKLHLAPEQVQIFTPTPSTYSSLMYYTEMDPFTGKSIFVEKDTQQKILQKKILTEKPANQQRQISKYKKKSYPPRHKKTSR
jgi:uncharacterized radical SAM protein YgiQ